MKYIILIILLITPTYAQNQIDTLLKNTLVIIDAGHGGKDPGASTTYNGNIIWEDEYAYDIGLKLKNQIEACGGKALMTVIDINQPAFHTNQEILPLTYGEIFAFDSSLVTADSTGLQKRCQFGNLQLKKFPKTTIVWISIHLDIAADSATQGVMIIAPDTNSLLAKNFRDVFAKNNLLRDSCSLVKNKDRPCRIRNLHVLRTNNKIKDRIFLELGNMLNKYDLSLIISEQGRNNYVHHLMNGLQNFLITKQFLTKLKSGSE